LVYGGEDGNAEFEEQLGQGLMNYDSAEEVAENVHLEKDDAEDEDEEESLFDEEGNLKNKKDDNLPKLEAMNKKQLD